MWTTDKYTPADLPQVIELTKSFYGDVEISDEEFLRWQYEQNPAGPAIIMLAKDNDLLAGQYIIIPTKFQKGSEIVYGTLSLNTLTRKEYWGKGIFTKLAESAYAHCQDNGIQFTYGFPNPNSYPGFVKKLKFADLGQVPLLLRPLNLKSLVSKKAGFLLGGLAAPFNPIFTAKKREFPGLEVFELQREQLGLIDNFWLRIKNKYPLMMVRDAEFMNWRYYDIPLRRYKIYGVKKELGSDLLGYIIGRCKDVEGMQSGMIADFIVAPNHAEAGSALISHLLRYFMDSGMELAGSLMMPQTEEYALLKANGFYKCPKSLEPQPFPVIFRSHGQKDNDQIYMDFNNWFLTMGDYDVI